MTETTETIVPNTDAVPQPIVEEINKTQPIETKTEQENKAEETSKTEEKEDPKFASRFAALSRKEKELITREKAFKESQAKLLSYEKALQTAKSNPLEYLQAAGLTLEEALQTIISKDQPVTEQTRIKSIEDKITEYENAIKLQREQNQKALEEQQLNQIKSAITQFVDTKPEDYELIKEYNAIDDVWSVIEQTYIETKGQVHLTIEQASKAVEEQLLEEAKLEAQRIAKIKKLKAKSESSSEEDPIKVSKKEEKVMKQPSKTLTNTSATASTTVPKKFKSREESIAEAAKLIKWT